MVQDLLYVLGHHRALSCYESPIYILFGLAARELVRDQKNHSLKARFLSSGSLTFWDNSLSGGGGGCAGVCVAGCLTTFFISPLLDAGRVPQLRQLKPSPDIVKCPF